MSSDETKEILFKEIDLAHTSILDTWKVYMTWYTFFFSANLVVMSWVFVHPDEIAKSASAWLLSLFWIVFNSTGLISSVWLARYSYIATRRMEAVLGRLNELAQLTNVRSVFPLSLSVMGALFNALALLANIIAWTYIWIKF